MKRYINLYEDILTRRNMERDKYAKIQFSSEEYIKYNGYKKFYRNFWYGYLIGIVLIAIALLIACKYKNEWFNTIWITYFAILVLNTVCMYIVLTIILQNKMNLSNKARAKELLVASKASEYSLKLAKISITIYALNKHNCYLNYKKKQNDMLEGQIIANNYAKLAFEKHNYTEITDEIVADFQSWLINGEKNA